MRRDQESSTWQVLAVHCWITGKLPFAYFKDQTCRLHQHRKMLARDWWHSWSEWRFVWGLCSLLTLGMPFPCWFQLIFRYHDDGWRRGSNLATQTPIALNSSLLFIGLKLSVSRSPLLYSSLLLVRRTDQQHLFVWAAPDAQSPGQPRAGRPILWWRGCSCTFF